MFPQVLNAKVFETSVVSSLDYQQMLLNKNLIQLMFKNTF